MSKVIQFPRQQVHVEEACRALIEGSELRGRYSKSVIDKAIRIVATASHEWMASQPAAVRWPDPNPFSKEQMKDVEGIVVATCMDMRTKILGRVMLERLQFELERANAQAR